MVKKGGKKKGRKAGKGNGEKKEDVRRKIFQEELRTAEQTMKSNLRQLNQKWLPVMRKAHAAELLADCTIHKQTFERTLKYQDNVIQALVCELNELEQLLELAHRPHVQNMDNLVEVHQSRLAELESRWKTSVEKLVTDWNTEMNLIVQQYEEEAKCMESKTSAIEKHYAEIDNKAKQDHQFALTNLEKENIDLKRLLHNQIKGTTEELQNKLDDFLEVTDVPCVQEDALAADMQEIQSEITELQQTASALHSKLRSKLMQQEENVEKYAQVGELKAALANQTKATTAKLTNMTTCSYNPKQKLRNALEEAANVLYLANLCNKIDTDLKQKHPFYVSSLNAEELRQLKAHALEAMSDELAQTMVDYKDLENFWQRYNTVRLECFCLKREKNLLISENKKLLRLANFKRVK